MLPCSRVATRESTSASGTTWLPTPSPSARTSSRAASSRRWSWRTRSCASSRAPWATPAAWWRNPSPRRWPARPSIRTTRARPPTAAGAFPRSCCRGITAACGSGGWRRAAGGRRARASRPGSESTPSKIRRRAAAGRAYFFACERSLSRLSGELEAMSTIIESIEQRQLKRVPRFNAGDRVRVHFQVVEGTRRRTQVFEGVVIARSGSGARETFTVRKQSFGVGVERTFPVHSPKIERLEVVARGDVRRAKLYYLRGRVGKRARVAERRWGIEDDLVLAAEETEAVDSEGVAQSEAEPEVVDAEEEAEAAPEEQPGDAASEEPTPDEEGE